MKRQNLNQKNLRETAARVFLLGLSAISFIGTFTGCAPAEFSFYDDSNGSLGSLDPISPICDPFDQSNIISATSGLKGTIHYLEANQSRVTKSTELINQGKKVNASLFLNRLFVPTRLFNTGFSPENSAPIKDGSGNVLVEWFALNLKSKLKLGPGETAGDYQLAVLSDDGSTLSLENDKGFFETLIDNEGTHPTQMACASKVVSMTSTTKIPLNLSYFQGPREHISLVVMWRKIPSGAAAKSLADAECGKSGNDYFFNVGTASSAPTPKKPYQDLLSRGWKPLTQDNFELQSGSNSCAI